MCKASRNSSRLSSGSSSHQETMTSVMDSRTTSGSSCACKASLLTEPCSISASDLDCTTTRRSACDNKRPQPGSDWCNCCMLLAASSAKMCTCKPVSCASSMAVKKRSSSVASKTCSQALLSASRLRSWPRDFNKEMPPSESCDKTFRTI